MFGWAIKSCLGANLPIALYLVEHKDDQDIVSNLIAVAWIIFIFFIVRILNRQFMSILHKHVCLRFQFPQDWIDPTECFIIPEPQNSPIEGFFRLQNCKKIGRVREQYCNPGGKFV